MNVECIRHGHDWKKVYPDQDLIDGIIFKQEIEEIWVCERCRKAERRIGTIGKIIPH